jgi:hypothetical protein
MVAAVRNRRYASLPLKAETHELDDPPHLAVLLLLIRRRQSDFSMAALSGAAKDAQRDDYRRK